MDFTGRGSQPAQPAATSSQFSGNAPSAGNKKNKTSGKSRNLKSWGAGLLGLLILALVVALIVVVASGKKSEANYVDESRLQAVFLQTGQVYFGDIKDLNSDFIELENIYYLQTSSNGDTAAASSNANVSLVKLGCELHAPFDRMIINREQVTFWENLQDDGQVAKAVKTFQDDNPDGQKCADQSAAPNSNTNVQGTPNTQNNNSTRESTDDDN